MNTDKQLSLVRLSGGTKLRMNETRPLGGCKVPAARKRRLLQCMFHSPALMRHRATSIAFVSLLPLGDAHNRCVSASRQGNYAITLLSLLRVPELAKQRLKLRASNWLPFAFPRSFSS
jgi:hypothetical protein